MYPVEMLDRANNLKSHCVVDSVCTIALSPLVWMLVWLTYLNGSAHLSTHLFQFGGRETREQLDFIIRMVMRANPAVFARGMLARLRDDATAVLPTIPVST